MVEVLSLSRDSNYQTKKEILEQLTQAGQIDSIKAQLRSQVIKALEQQKKKSFGGASKYL